MEAVLPLPAKKGVVAHLMLYHSTLFISNPTHSSLIKEQRPCLSYIIYFPNYFITYTPKSSTNYYYFMHYL